jgi:hypothetical protein
LKEPRLQLVQRFAVELRAVALKLRDLPLNPRIAVLKLGAHGFPHLGPAERRRVVTRSRGEVRRARLLVPASAIRSLLPL